MIVEVVTFRATDEYLALEPRLYEEVVVKRGFIRRTTARNGDEWCAVQLWDSLADAEAGWSQEFERAVEIVSVKRYEDLGG